jgi:phosphoserine phosphatase
MSDWSGSGSERVPLCVDLDGTLVKSDTLVDSLLAMARTRPELLLKLPGRLLHGKAAFKAFVSASVSLDVPHLPYNRLLLHFLQQQRAQGRVLYLTTGADERLAQRVAAHLGIFKGVLGSDGAINLTGSNKLDRLRSHLNSGEFSYIGNARADLPLLAHATEPMVANPSLGLRLGLRARGIHPTQEFVERSHILKSLLKAIRLHQWAKNLLIFVPLLLSHRLNLKTLSIAFAAFLSFSLVASATYIVNDLLDIDADRRHPRKRLRPFASGDLSVLTGLGISTVLVLLALASGWRLSVAYHGWRIGWQASRSFCFSPWPSSSASPSWRICAPAAPRQRTAAATWWPICSRCAVSARPAPSLPWWSSPTTSAAAT